MLNVAREWGYLAVIPKFRKNKLPETIPRPMRPDDFEATMPAGLPYASKDWWQAVLVLAVTTGWRKEEILDFRRDDLDLETGVVLTRAADQSGAVQLGFVGRLVAEVVRLQFLPKSHDFGYMESAFSDKA